MKPKHCNIMDAASTQYRVRVCSMCPGDAEDFCASCLCNLFLHCRENHVNNLKTIDHNVVIRKKYHYMPIQELCMTHPGKAYKKYCERCELSVCNRCRKHRNHRQVVLKKKKHIKAKLNNIRQSFTPSDVIPFFQDMFSREISKLKSKLSKHASPSVSQSCLQRPRH